MLDDTPQGPAFSCSAPPARYASSAPHPMLIFSLGMLFGSFLGGPIGCKALLEPKLANGMLLLR